MKLEIEFIKENQESAYRHVFSKRQLLGADLTAALEKLNKSMPLGWQYKTSLICPGLWARTGAFVSVTETFVDAFDHTVYKENVWRFSNGKAMTSVNGLELHGWGARPDPADGSDIILLEKVEDLQHVLSTIPKDTPVFSPSNNFELGGCLENAINLYCVKDTENRVWLILQADSRAGR